jgi:hypothetical protein
MNFFKTLSAAFVLLVLLFLPGSAMAQAEPAQGPTPMNAPEQSASEGEQLTKITTQGTHIYLLCIYGKRSQEVIIRSCKLKEDALREAYERPDSNPKMTVIRVNNPSKEQLENIRSNLGNKIAVVHVVAHSTLDENKPEGFGWTRSSLPGSRSLSESGEARLHEKSSRVCTCPLR